MPGAPVTFGCAVTLSFAPPTPSDSGIISIIPPGGPTVGGLPLAMTGSICTMTNSLSGATYPFVIGPVPSGKVTINGRSLLRMGDEIIAGTTTLVILGPPATTSIFDTTG